MSILDEMQIRVTNKILVVQRIRVDYESKDCALLFVVVHKDHNYDVDYGFQWRKISESNGRNNIDIYLMHNTPFTKDASAIHITTSQYLDHVNFEVARLPSTGLIITAFKQAIPYNKRRNIYGD